MLLTHTYFDPIYSLNAIVQKFPLVKIITNELGLGDPCSPKLNISHCHTDCEYFVFNGTDKSVQICSDPEPLTICGLEVKIIPTPGHDRSCLSYQIGNCLFTGDSYIQGIKVVANWPKSNKKDAATSEARLREMEEKEMTILAGHEV